MLTGSGTVIAADPSNTDVKMKLAELYEILNQPRKALDLVYQGSSPIFPTFVLC
jgi:hypothetical protein